jgi:hypothetical protein
LFPRSNVASSRSGASSHPISFCAVLLPCAARCRILYLLLARIAVSESEKNADSAKKTINGATKIVDIQGWVLGYWNLAAAFRHGFLDAIFDFQFRQVHDCGQFGNEKESSAIKHALFAE